MGLSTITEAIEEIKTGKFVINPKFDSAYGFSEGLAAVVIDGKWGYISR